MGQKRALVTISGMDIQCDQIGRNFTTLEKFKKPSAVFEGI